MHPVGWAVHRDRAFLWYVETLNQSEDVGKEQRATTKPSVSLNSCIIHPSTEQWEKRINTDSCYAQAASGIFDRESTKKKTEDRGRWGGKENDEAQSEGQRCSLMLPDNSRAPFCCTALTLFLTHDLLLYDLALSSQSAEITDVLHSDLHIGLNQLCIVHSYIWTTF